MEKNLLTSKLTDHRRLVNWWVRFEDLNWPSPDNIDRVKMRAEKMAEANITTAILFGAHFRWDYLPYFTLLHDHIAFIAEQLHQYGIELYDRHSVNLIHRYETPEQMRHVMLHSGPHVPFSPSWEGAACWEYKGKRLNDWRMIDVRTREVLYYPQYAGEGFCYNNPEYLEAYCDYAKRLIADTGIDGLAAEDPTHYMHFASCACPHCRETLKRRAGIDLPPVEDRTFWGNWENPAWKEWIDLRYDTGRDFFTKLKPYLPENFPVTTCGSDSASASMNGKASDARVFMSGVNYVHSEWSGNTPPYFPDSVTANIPVPNRAVTSSHHLAVAKEYGVRCFTTGYGFTEPSANIIWALNKLLDQDCCFATLKARLGLPQRILDTLPEEYDVIKHAFTFEKDHPELFEAKQIGQMGVYFSYETRNHTLFGNLTKGYYKDYAATLRTLFTAGLSPHTVFAFPENTEEYPVILLSSAASMTEAEKTAMNRYLASGGKVIVTGPSALPGCENSWVLPTKPDIAQPLDFFDTIANGVWHKSAEWVTGMAVAPTEDPDAWTEVRPGLWYNPRRISEESTAGGVLELCRKWCSPLPVAFTESDGYMVTVFENEGGVTAHLLAEKYDTDIDHHLDEIRFHRSRVNYVNKADPMGVTRTLRGTGETAPKVFLPLNEEPAEVTFENGHFTVNLPEKCAYVLLRFAAGSAR